MHNENAVTPNTESKPNVGDEFMLAEFENMRYFHEEDTSISERRVDVLLAVTSGIAAGMVLSLLPMCATWPNDRLLLFSGLGGFG